jgi:hypothetical protein
LITKINIWFIFLRKKKSPKSVLLQMRLGLMVTSVELLALFQMRLRLSVLLPTIQSTLMGGSFIS